MRDFVYRLAVRLFLPHLNESLKHEDAASVFREGEPEYVVIEDRGSDKTIFSFAGAAMLYAGMPAFEFRRMLCSLGDDFNLVFFRDVYRMMYHVGPHGQRDGLEFYEAEIHRIIEALGSKHHVAIGASAGAGAAVYFGTRCRFDRIIAFNQPLPTRVWSEARAQVGNLCNLKGLLLHPGEYMENVLISLAATWIHRQLRRASISPDWDPFGLYMEAQERPPMSVFYGSRCRCDARNAARLKDVAEVRLIPLPVGLHNCATYLKKRGEMGYAIQAQLDGLHTKPRAQSS